MSRESTRMIPAPLDAPPPPPPPAASDGPTQPPTKVTITGDGISVTIEAGEPMADVTRAAQDLHRDLQAQRTLPAGFGGML